MPSWVQQIIETAALALGFWFTSRYKTPTDKQRAELLSHIANDAAALIVTMMPGASWAVLLQALIAKLSGAAGLPTRNAEAIQQAAASALINALTRANVKATGAPSAGK